ncbi:MAG TPA: M23 family metallopeptidase [Rectinemataceae bacterium]|nr:M23 family metallopeptidase [Rectinemataceae bacterium]
MPEGLREFKRKEKLFYVRLVAGTKAFFRGAISLPRRFILWSGRRTSIIFLPHSGGRSKRLQPSHLALCTAAIAFIGLVGFAAFASTRYLAAVAMLETAKHDLADSRAAIDGLRDSAEALTGSALRFETRLSDLLSIAARKQVQPVVTASGDEALRAAGLSELLNMPASGGLAYRELERLRGLTGYLDAAVPGLEQVATILAGQKEIMSEIPNIWPIQGGAGHVSMYFGQNENPFSGGQWYLHNGIDISTFRTGDTIIASADGKVIDVSYDASLGNCVTIQHSHGFLTRYGHLRSFRVTKGQQVAQGQSIGTLGNTGKTTGPHLHYEVHLGTSVIDPLRFLNVRKTTNP